MRTKLANLLFSCGLALATSAPAQTESLNTIGKNAGVPTLAGPLQGEYFWHELGTPNRDIGFFFESPVGLVGDNETHYVSFEFDSNSLFDDSTMHMVVSVSGDTFVRTNGGGEVVSASDVQLGGRGFILGVLDVALLDGQPHPQCSGRVSGIGIEDFGLNRINGRGVVFCESLANVDVTIEPATHYKLEVHATSTWVSYVLFKDRYPQPNVTSWELVRAKDTFAPQATNDRYYGNVVISTASRSSTTSSLQLSNVYVGKFGAPPEHVPEITNYVNSCSNRFCVSLSGDNFDVDASVLIRKKEPTLNDPVVEITANEIFIRKFQDPDDLIFFPLVDLDLQAAWISDGLCFTVKNSQGLSNETCHQRTANPVIPDFMGQRVRSYSTVQDEHYTSFLVKGDAAPLSGGNTLKLRGNSWKIIDYPYTVTASTHLNFDFLSNQQEGEINGVGLRYSDGSEEFWQVFGTDTYGRQTHHDYSGTAFKSYSIPVGSVRTGTVVEMFFVGDADHTVGQNAVYKSPTLVN